jgi:hypothetical protein
MRVKGTLLSMMDVERGHPSETFFCWFLYPVLVVAGTFLGLKHNFLRALIYEREFCE